LATRPAPQLPGRIFVDTDNPSTGMYRDTGTVWVQLSSGSGTVPDLQTVCNVGFLTDTDMTFLYTNSADTSKIGFLNQAVGNFTFDIFKKANELFAIRALKPSTVDEEMEIIFDAPNNRIKSSYNSIDTGLLMDFVTNDYLFGNYTGNDAAKLSISINGNSFSVTDVYFGHTYFSVLNDSTDVNFPGLIIDGTNNIIKTQSNSVDLGLLLDFASKEFFLGDPAGNDASKIEIIGYNINLKVTNNNFSLNFDDSNNLIETVSNSNYIGIKLDFQNDKYTLGSTSEYIGIDTANNTLIAGANLLSGTSGGNSGQHLKININGTNYKIELKNP
jgi:hypothetical protein